MKKLLLIILACPILLIGIGIEETSAFGQPEDNEATTFNEPIRKDHPDVIQIHHYKIASEQERQGVPSLKPAESGLPLDFEKYNKEDIALKAKRNLENTQQKQAWEKETAAAAQKRNEESILERAFKAISSDPQADAEIESTRNKVRLDINRKRMVEDLKTRTARLSEFKEKYNDFSEKAPWNHLLELNDTESFLNKSYAQRTDSISALENGLRNLDVITIEDGDIQAIQDLIKLTRPQGTKLPDQITDVLTKELSNSDPAKIKEVLLEQLRTSLPETIETLKTFNKDMKSVQKDIKSLEDIRRIKNIGMAVFWVLGAVAVVVMVIHMPIILGPIVLSMETCAIAAKVGFYFYHTGHHEEAEKAMDIQTKFLDAFQPLLPETTALLRTESYKSSANSLMQRLDNNITGTLNETWKDRYQSVKDHIKSGAHAISEKINQAKDSIAKSSAGKWISRPKTTQYNASLDMSEFNPWNPTTKKV